MTSRPVDEHYLSSYGGENVPSLRAFTIQDCLKIS
jgi:hypothetical protein